jgi:hypothetical protein
MKRIADKRELKGDEVVGDERNTTKTRLNISIGKNKNFNKSYQVECALKSRCQRLLAPNRRNDPSGTFGPCRRAAETWWPSLVLAANFAFASDFYCDLHLLLPTFELRSVRRYFQRRRRRFRRLYGRRHLRDPPTNVRRRRGF